MVWRPTSDPAAISMVSPDRFVANGVSELFVGRVSSIASVPSFVIVTVLVSWLSTSISPKAIDCVERRTFGAVPLPMISTIRRGCCGVSVRSRSSALNSARRVGLNSTAMFSSESGATEDGASTTANPSASAPRIVTPLTLTARPPLFVSVIWAVCVVFPSGLALTFPNAKLSVFSMTSGLVTVRETVSLEKLTPPVRALLAWAI